MSTIYAFQESETAVTTPPAATDAFIVYNAAAKATRQVPGALLAEAARTISTAPTTSSAFPSFGITRASTLLAVNTITDPTQAGQETTILFPASTAIQTVAPVAATILGSTVTATGATKITKTGTSDGVAASITLIAASTALWYIKSIGGTQITTT